MTAVQEQTASAGRNVPIAQFYAYKTSRYGLPWVCRYMDGSYDFGTQVGMYTGEKGREGNLIVFAPVPGQIYAFGQKDYRDGSGTIKAFAMWTGQEFAPCDRNGYACQPHTLNENEKDMHRVLKPLPQNPVRDAVNAERLDPDPKPIYPYPVKADLYAHQVRGANMALLTLRLVAPEDVAENKRLMASGEFPEQGVRRYTPTTRMDYGFGLIFDMGLGKTITQLAIAGAAYQLGRVRKLLIVAPTSVCSVWPAELARFAGFEYETAFLTGTKSKRLAALEALSSSGTDAMKIAVINYESVWRSDILQALEEWKPDMIACDESQRIKNPKAHASLAMHRLGNTAKYKLILSGTPVQNNILDLFSQYKFLCSRTFGDNYWAFRNRYAIMGGYEDKQVVGFRDLDELALREHDIAYRCRKDEALDLPEQTFRTISLQMPDKVRKMYDELVEMSYAELDGLGSVSANNVLTKIVRLQQFTGGFIVPDDGAGIPAPVYGGKLDALGDIIDDYVIETGRKLVIFCRFKSEIGAIGDLLEAKGVTYAGIHGGISVADRSRIVEDFQNSPDPKCLVCQIDTAGTGLTLTAADTCVYYSLTYNYATYAQSLARIHRIGQVNACTYIHLCVEQTIDEIVLQALDQKKDMASLVVDDWRKLFRVKKKKAAKKPKEEQELQTSV